MPTTADPPTPAGNDAREGRTIGARDLTVWPTPVGRAAARSVTRASSRFGARTTLILILGAGIVVAFLLAFGAARVYDGVTESDGIAGLDRPALALAMGLRSPALDGLAAGIAYLFGPIGMPLIALAGCLTLALRRRSVTPVLLTVAAGVGSLLMTIAGKDIIDRHRPRLVDAIPPYEHSPSFPSGHTLNAVVICGVLTYLVLLTQRSAGVRAALVAATVLVAVAVGLSRVLLGAHWLTDVVAGWLLGGAWLALVITAHRLYLTARRRRAASANPAVGRA
jgi:undecaprenyl-diphosphatase